MAHDRGRHHPYASRNNPLQPRSGPSTSLHPDPGPPSGNQPSSSHHIPSHQQPPTQQPHAMPSPASLALLLRCPLCTAPLHNPTTLYCGHSICARHVTDPPGASSVPPPSPTTLPLCPLRDCHAKSPTSTLPRFPANPRVRFTGPPPSAQESSQTPPQPATVPEPRLDVSVNKIIALVARTNQALQAQEQIPDPNQNSDSDSPHGHTGKRRRRRRRSPVRSQQGQDDLSHPRTKPFRERALPTSEPPLSPTNDSLAANSRDAILARFEKELLAELNCEICFVLLYQPITTPCQHTFCAKCLQRSLDHRFVCPLCRQELPGFGYFEDHPANKALLSIILEGFPMVYKERGDALAAEERDARLDCPFVSCQLAFPFMSVSVQLDEPRFRLMLRRCLESTYPRFGMTMRPKAGSPLPDYGTMLEIRSVQLLPGGRSLVETRGSFRFRILERGILDGYMVGRIEVIADYPEDISSSSLQLPLGPPDPADSSFPDSSPTASHPDAFPSTSHLAASPSAAPLPIPFHPSAPSNEELMTICRTFLHRLQQGTAPWIVQRISDAFGHMPTDPFAFSFWVASVLPIDDQEKSKLLPLRTIRLRLLLVVHWIQHLNNQWWFSSGCTVL